MLPNPPEFTIVAASDAYLRATMTRRADILGRGVFEIFPNNPEDTEANGVENLRASLLHVIWNRVPHAMLLQKYDVRRPKDQGGEFEERYWSPVNTPVFGVDGQIKYLLHRIEDVTAFVRLEEGRQRDQEAAEERHIETERRAAHHLLRAEGLQETNSQLLRVMTELREQEAEIRGLNSRLQRSVTETHHRVKNNLQLVSALIDLHQQAGRATISMEELVRLGQNVRAMGAIHDLLMQQSKVDGFTETLSAKALLEQLVTLIDGALQGRGLKLIAEEVPVSGRQATALALLTNELLSNALKHGRGEITVRLRQEGETIHLETCDEGPGFAPGFDPKRAARTGLELIENIARFDLQGRIAYHNRETGGACVIVTFAV